MKRRIYFAGSIRGGRNDKELYSRLIRHPVLCLFRNQGTKKLSAMIAGNPKLHILRYDAFADAVACLDNFFNKADEKV